MNIGFTGTRMGMTHAQREAMVQVILRLPWSTETECHHGNCIGADAQFHDYVTSLGLPTHVHDPLVQGEDFAGRKGTLHYPPKTNFARNRDIEAASQVCVGAPWQDRRPPPKSGGGTWYTIERFEKSKKPIYICWPDGHIEEINVAV